MNRQHENRRFFRFLVLLERSIYAPSPHLEKASRTTKPHNYQPVLAFNLPYPG